MAAGPGGREAGRVSLKVVPDTSEVYEELKALERYVKGLKLTIKVELDTASLRTELRSLKQLAESNPIEIPVKYGDPGRLDLPRPDTVEVGVEYERPLSSPTDGLDLGDETVKVDVDLETDTAAFLAQLKADLAALQQQLGKLKIPAEIDLEGDLRDAAVEAQKLKTVFERVLRGIDVDIDADIDDAEVRAEMRRTLAGLQGQARKDPVEVKIDLDADTTGFLTKLRVQLAALERQLGKMEIPAEIDLQGDYYGALGEAQKLRKLLEKALRGVDVDLDLDSEGVREDLRDTLAVLQAYAQRHTLDIEVDLDAKGLVANLQRELALAKAMVGKVKVPVGAELEHQKILAEMALLKRKLDLIATIDAEMDVDTTEALAEVRAAIAKMQAYAKLHGIEVPVDVDHRTAKKSLSKLDSMLAAIGSKLARTFSLPNLTNQAGQIKAMFTAILAFSPDLAVLAGDLTKLAGGGLALLPALAGAAAGSFTALKLAIGGMGEAITTGDPEVLAEALRSMAPSAGQAVLAIRAVKKEYASIGLSVQEAVWKDLAAPFRKLAKEAFPVLKAGLTDLGTAWNATFKAMIAAARDLVKNGTVTAVLAGAAQAGRNAAAGIQPFIAGLGTLAKVGSKYLPELGTMLADMGKKFGAWMTDLQKTGTLDNLFKGLLQGLKDIASIAGSVFSILGSIYKAAQAAGGTGLSGLRDVMAKIAVLFKDPEFQKALTAFFTGIKDGMKAIGDALSSSGGGFKEFLTTLGEIARQVGPIIGEIFKTMAMFWETMGPTIRELAQILGPLIVKMLQEMRPHLKKLMEAVGPLMVAIATIVADVLPAVLEMTGPLIDFMATIIGWIAKLIQWLAPLIGFILKVVLGFFPYFRAFKIASGVVKLLIKHKGVLINVIKNLIGWIVGLAKKAGPAFTKIWQFAKNMVGKIIGFFKALPGAVRKAWNQFFEIGKNIITGIWNGMKSVGGWFKEQVGGFLKEHLPDFAKKALGIGSPAKAMLPIGAASVEGIVAGMGQREPWLRSQMTAFMGRYIRAIEDPIAKEFREIGRYAADELVKGMVGTADQAVDAVKNLVEKIRAQADRIFDRTQEQAEAYGEKMAAVAERIAEQRARVAEAEKKAADARAKNGLAIRQEELSLQQLAVRIQQINAQIAAARNPKQTAAASHADDIREGLRDIDLLRKKLALLRQTTDDTAAGRVAIARQIRAAEEQIHDKQRQIEKWRASTAKKTTVDANKVRQLELARQQALIQIEKTKLRIKQLSGGSADAVAREKANLAKLEAAYRSLGQERNNLIAAGSAAEARAQWAAQYLENLETMIEATATARDKIREELDKARQDLESIMDKMAEYVNNVISSITSAMNITRTFDAEEQAVELAKAVREALSGVADEGGAIGQFAEGWAARMSAAIAGTSGETASAVLESMKDAIKALGPQVGAEQANLLTRMRIMVDQAMAGAQTDGAKAVVDRAKRELEKVKDFVGTVKRLAAMNLNSTWLDQVIQAGPFSETVGAFKEMSQAQVDELNRIATEMTGHAQQIGMTGADAMYSAGRDAVTSLIAGLESQEAALTAAINRIADEIRDILEIGLGVKVAPPEATVTMPKVPGAPAGYTGTGPYAPPVNVDVTVNQRPDGGWDFDYGAAFGEQVNSAVRRAARTRAGRGF